jgi:CBS domain-containing protein
MLTSMPKPKAELIIAIAGPIVNFVIAAIIFALTPELHNSNSETLLTSSDSFIVELFKTNIFIGLFNLIPAIPMDGGRILRSLLAIFKVDKATVISARISQGCSIVMGIIGIATGSIMLMVISGIVFLGAMQELITDQTQSSAEGKIAKDFMVEKEKLYCFSHGTTLQDSIRIAIKSSQEFFPVIYSSSLLGTIDRDDLISAATTSDESNEYLSGIMNRDTLSFDVKTPIKTVLDTAVAQGASVVAVVEDQDFCGLIFVNRVSELLMIDTIRAEKQKFEEEHDGSNFPGF